MVGMFGFLTKSKSKTESAGGAKKDSGPKGSDNLSDPVQDPLVAKAQSVAANDKTESGGNDKKAEQPAAKGPGLLDRLFKTQKYQDSQEAKITEVMENTKPSVIQKHYWKELYEFAASEYSTENMDMIEAIEGNANPSSIYNLWIKTGAPMEANLDAKVVAPLHALAAKGLYDSMDFGDVLRVARSNLADTVGRFMSSSTFREAVRKRMK